MTPFQLHQLAAVYDTIARLMPVEGRDYTVKIDFHEGRNPTVKMDGLTEFGRKWVEYCMHELGKRYQSNDERKTDQAAASPMPKEQSVL